MTVTSNVDLNVASFNETIMLTCSGSGGPNNTLQWERDGAVIDGETSDTLTLLNVDASLGGVYTCTVSNTAGNESANATLYVSPYIITTLKEQFLRLIGSTVNITCEAGGFPSPDISWVQINTDMIVMQVSSTSLLELIPVSYENAGVYRCVATAEIGGVTFNATDETILFGKRQLVSFDYNTCILTSSYIQFLQRVALLLVHKQKLLVQEKTSL